MAAETLPMKVEDFLENVSEKKSAGVDKPIDVDVDAGNLLAFDVNSIDLQQIRKDREQFLLNFTKTNVQFLVNCLSELPVEKKDDITIIKLPEPKTVLPREKAVPKPKQPTKWEQYAQLKGIQKKKKGRMVWDEESQQYKPRWGFKSKDKTKSWLLEVPDNADPMQDQFEKVKKEKRERVAKNELQRLRNIGRSTKSKVPGVGLTPTATPSKKHLETALSVTHRSTASLGQFMETLPKEKLKNKKRKFESNYAEGEQERQKKILKKISTSTAVVDVNRAANALQHSEERQRAASKTPDGRKKAGKKGGVGGGKKGRGGGGKKGGVGKKGVGGGKKGGKGKKGGVQKRR
ncbi:ribosome biogenesis regulatory protein homolog [Babylonia areolata]|uniref:ribosome biogenesis regulatory protein homolog n=1 Tax=Babylonia areolata TaxID=304850 RepID=UPI003FD574D3